MATPTPTVTATTRGTVSARTTSWAPTAKVSAGALAGSATTLIAVFLKSYFKNKGIEFKPEISVAITAVIKSIWTPLDQWLATGEEGVSQLR